METTFLLIKRVRTGSISLKFIVIRRTSTKPPRPPSPRHLHFDVQTDTTIQSKLKSPFCPHETNSPLPSWPVSSKDRRDHRGTRGSLLLRIQLRWLDDRPHLGRPRKNRKILSTQRKPTGSFNLYSTLENYSCPVFSHRPQNRPFCHSFKGTV